MNTKLPILHQTDLKLASCIEIDSGKVDIDTDCDINFVKTISENSICVERRIQIKLKKHLDTMILKRANNIKEHIYSYTRVKYNLCLILSETIYHIIGIFMYLMYYLCKKSSKRIFF